MSADEISVICNRDRRRGAGGVALARNRRNAVDPSNMTDLEEAFKMIF